MITRIKNYVQLMRPYQWYKNLLVYLGVIFGQHLFDVAYVTWATVGFVALCLVSSASYVLNDLKDAPRDRVHPEKRLRPLASGVVQPLEAYGLFVILVAVGFGVALLMPTASDSTTVDEMNGINIITPEGKTLFLMMLVVIFVTSQAYSWGLKNVVIVDITTLSLNYVWRALSGTVLLNIAISPWLIVLSFLGALFLSSCKRKADLELLADNAIQHKPVFLHYTPDLLNQIITIVAAAIIFAFSLYTFVGPTTSRHSYLVLTVPLVTFIIFRYLYLLSAQARIARAPERIFLDTQLVIAGVVLFLFFMGALYTDILDQTLGKFFLSLSEFVNNKLP